MHRESLASIYSRFATPEGYGDKGTAHSYVRVYEQLFEPLRDSARSVLEIGVGSDALSLRMWAAFFERAIIVGVDTCVVADSLPTSVRVVRADAYDARTVETLTSYGPFDVIIDDGSHALADQLFVLREYRRLLGQHGWLIVEDVQGIDTVAAAFRALENRCEVHDLRHVKGRYDDVLVTYRQ